MIYTYGTTQRGWTHIKKEIVCQDSHKIYVNKNICIAAVADGLGSEKYSDIASQIASEVSVVYCSEHITEDLKENEILNIICESFTLALNEIEKKAKSNKHDIDQYDTTLSLCVFIDGNLFFGHAGDSGIIAYTSEGEFINITEQQRDEEGRVFPLCFGVEKWVFGKYEKKVSSVLLATDGIYELFFPVYIRKRDVSIYTALADYFMSKESLNIQMEDFDVIQKSRIQYVSNIPPSIVDDDKTLLVVINTDVEVNRQPDSYYAEPDWAKLQKEYQEAFYKKAYPDLGNN